jgi:hypothetical protein
LPLAVNVAGTKVFPIALKLAERNIPFVFISGYSGYHLPQEWRNRPKLEKPFEPHAYDRRNFHFAIETVVRGIELDDAPRVVSERVHFALAALADAPAEAHPVSIYK